MTTTPVGPNAPCLSFEVRYWEEAPLFWG